MSLERRESVHINDAGRYVLDSLGAPFEVVLLNGVHLSVDPKTNSEVVVVEDLVGLIGAVVRQRTLHPRKLSGPEIKFVRDALSVRAVTLAKFLDISAEHLSRCEAGAKILSTGSEKLLRLYAYLATYATEPSDMFEVAENEHGDLEPSTLGSDANKKAMDFLNVFLKMKIQSVFDASSAPLEFVFERTSRKKTIENDPENEDWATATAA